MRKNLVILSLILWSTSTSHAQCSYTNGVISLTWTIDAQLILHFDFFNNNFTQNQWWTAIGFGKNHWDNLDLIVMLNQGGRLTLTTGWVYAYSTPQVDSITYLTGQSISLNDGILRAQFSRPLTNVYGRHMPSLDGCVRWNFANVGGPMLSNGSMGIHLVTPVQQTICDIQRLCQDGGDNGIQLTVTNPPFDSPDTAILEPVQH